MLARAVLTLSVLAGMAAASATVGQHRQEVLHLLELRLAADDPPALATLRIRRVLDEAGIAREIDAALRDGDPDLAASFVALADDQGLAVDPTQRARVQAAQASSPAEAGVEFLHGLVACDRRNLPATIAGDLVGYGDLCDLAHEGVKAWRGGPTDELVIGLAVAGLFATAATLPSAGTSLPARAGISVVKAARKSGHLSAAMTRFASRAGREAVDDDAVRAAMTAARRLDFEGARCAASRAIRPEGLRTLKALTDDAATLYARTGLRGVRHGLAVAENGDDLRRIARLAEAKGPATRAVLKTLGRGALVFGGIAGTLAAWSLALLAYVLALVWTLLAVLAWVLRRLWPRRRVRSAALRPRPLGA